jgi:hypothetical protein
MRQELENGPKNNPVKDTNIIKQGTVEIPMPVIPSRGLKPSSVAPDEELDSSGSEPASSEVSSATSSRNSSTVSLEHIPIKDKMISEDSMKRDNKRLVLEHKARLAKLSRLQEINSQEMKETASLLVTKKQIQEEILDLENLLAQRELVITAEQEKWWVKTCILDSL